MEYLKSLNPAQREAVLTTEGAVLVIAGAGSGKTRVIEYRVLHLVRQGVAPKRILLLTFTRRAAGEMLERAGRTEALCREVEGGTFHSFAFKMIRQYGERIGVPARFLVLDQADAEEAIAKSIEISGGASRLPKKDTFQKIISAARNKDMALETILEREYPQFLDVLGEVEKVARIYGGYKREKGYVDYDDLLFYLRDLLMDDGVRMKLARKYRYVMVDEFQDTNPVQGEIVHLLGREHGNVMVVGDDAQSIYGFRGASHENIMVFPRRFTKQRVVQLEENYRSTQEILDMANAALSGMEEKYNKRLISSGGRRGEKPRFMIFSNSYEEARWLAFKVERLRDSGVALCEQAALFRSAYVSIPLQTELARRGIDFRVFGGLKFYETAHVKDALACVRLAVNYRDELAWQRALMMIDGVGVKTSDGLSQAILGNTSLAAAVQATRALAAGKKWGAGARRLADFLERAGALREPAEIFRLAADYYLPVLKDKFDNWHQRMSDLEAVGEMAGQYENPADFLADVAINPTRGEGEGTSGLTLSTIHSAKGLEWQAVFLLGVSEGVLPSRFTFGDAEAIEEELRLFYVAITRAKDFLFLSHAGEGGTSRFLERGRVVDFLDGGGLELNPRNSAWGFDNNDGMRGFRGIEVW